MPANTRPIFPLTPHNAMAQVSVANTFRNGTGTTVTLITGAANGTLIERIWAHCTQSNIAGRLHFYLFDGVDTRLIFEQPTVALAVQPYLSARDYEITRFALFTLQSGWSIKVATEKAEVWNIFAKAGDY